MNKTTQTFLLTILFSLLGALAGGYTYNKFFKEKVYTVDTSLIYSLGYTPLELHQIISGIHGTVIDKSVVVHSPKSVKDITEPVLLQLRAEFSPNKASTNQNVNQNMNQNINPDVNVNQTNMNNGKQ